MLRAIAGCSPQDSRFPQLPLNAYIFIFTSGQMAIKSKAKTPEILKYQKKKK